MPKPIKSTRNSSTIIQVGFSKDTIKLMKEIEREWPERLKKARLFFLVDVGGYMLNRVKEMAPKIELDGEEKEYAKELRIGILEEGENEDVIAIYRSGETYTTGLKDRGRTVLYFQAHNGSPEWISVLNRYGPWPVEVLPVKVSPGQAKIIARYARPDELNALVKRLYEGRAEILREMSKAGAHGIRWRNQDYGVGLQVHIDLGYIVLREELGFDGEGKHPHWRPAFKDTKEYAKKCMEKVTEYITTGDEKVFDLPNKMDKADMSVIKEGESFSKEIAPFMK